MSEKDELKLRVEAKKKQIEAQLAKFRADSVSEANDAVEKLQKKLKSLESNLQHGWENVTENVAGKLNRWLADKE